MPDETEQTPQPDPPADPEVSTETPDQTPEPETPEQKGAASEEEVRFTHAAFTKLTQDLAEERKRSARLEERMNEALANLPGSRREVPEETPENPQVEKIVRGTKAYRDLASQYDSVVKQLRGLSSLTAEQVFTSRFPEIKEELPEFSAWVEAVPGRVEAMQAAGLKPEQVIAAYRTEHPAKRGKGVSKPPPKVPPRVETSSVPRGTIRDIRDKIREGGRIGRISAEEAFDTAVNEARRELKASGE